ncbi:MAG: sulfatase-like hydrolase/transferase [Pseudomonadota bacterium]|nr:sulfatase-like hydrolase/transferase [Pseudomonadota bacterium]
MLLLLLAACTGPAVTDEPGATCPENPGAVTADGPPHTVLLISVDTVNRDFLGVHHPEWDTTPTIDALFAEGVRLDNVLVPRGLSAVSMATMVTGAYPVTHRVRDNEPPEAGGAGIAAGVETLYQRFGAAGYTTYGWLANMCFLLDGDPAVQHRSCQSDDEVPGTQQDVGDARLATEAAEAIAALPTDEPFFGWVHFMDPHDPYDRRDPWYAEFHPDTYEGALQDPTEAELLAVSRGDTPYGDDDRRHVEAIYASQLRQTDEHVAALLAALSAAGRLEDAVIVIAFDHGDELARRSGYFFHGCSPYNGVMASTFGLRAPGRLPAGEVLANWVPSVDLVPTLLEVAGLPFGGPGEGRSLLSNVRGCIEPQHPAFFERGSETAGVILGNWKYILDPKAGYSKCKHYDGELPFPGAPEELYHLPDDPSELTNLADTRPEVAGVLRTQVCNWVRANDWSDDPENALLVACE